MNQFSSMVCLGGSLLNVLILATRALAYGSFSKCFLTGSKSSLMALATEGLRSPGCKSPLTKSS